MGLNLTQCFTARRKDMSKQAEDYPILEEIKTGWAAKGDGWTVHAPTREAVLQLYSERAKYYEWLDQQIREKASNGNNHNGDNHERRAGITTREEREEIEEEEKNRVGV